MKHTYKTLFFLFLFISFFNTTSALTDSELEAQITSGLFDYNEDLARMADDVVDINLDIKRDTKENAVGTLTGIVEAQTILQDSLYYRTHPLGRRNLLDRSIFQNYATFTPLTKISTSPFYSQTYKEYFYDERDGIKDYIDMKQEHLVRRLDDLSFTTFDFPKILSLFENLKVQERNVGFMFDIAKSNESWAFSIRFPLRYTEHNLFLTKKEIERIEKEPFFADFEGDPLEFAKEHLIADQFGIGDTRINFEKLIKKTNNYCFSIGGRFTVPTTFHFGKGLYGNYFDVNKPDTNFDLYTDLLKIPDDVTAPTATEQQQMKNNIVTFGNNILDRLSTILLSQGMQNNHHFGIGMFTHSTMYFKPHVYLSSLASAEIELPAPEKRFFLVKNDKAAFDSFNWDNAEIQIDAKLTFLNNQLKEKFFPPVFETMVFPGFVFQSTSALTYEAKNWDFIIGTDFWWKTKEHFLSIKAASVGEHNLEKELARRGNLYQTGVWFAAERYPSEGSDMQFGLRFGSTGLSKNIGQDVNFSFHVERFF